MSLESSMASGGMNRARPGSSGSNLGVEPDERQPESPNERKGTPKKWSLLSAAARAKREEDSWKRGRKEEEKKNRGWEREEGKRKEQKQNRRDLGKDEKANKLTKFVFPNPKCDLLKISFGYHVHSFYSNVNVDSAHRRGQKNIWSPGSCQEAYRRERWGGGDTF